MKLPASIVATLLSLFYGAAGIAKDNIYIGVIEETVKCPESRSETSVRVLFEKLGRAWTGIQEPRPGLEEFNWSIASAAGRDFNLRIVDPDPQAAYRSFWVYKRDKVFKLANGLDFERRLNEEKGFGSWCGLPRYAPQAITNSKQVDNTGSWQPFTASAADVNFLYPFLKISMGKTNAFRCDYEQTPNTVPYNFGPDELIVHKSLKKGTRKLISLGIDTSLLNCDGPPLPEWSGNWFLVEGNSVEFLGNELEYLESGDFDADGTEEVLFWHSGYNRDGYVLFFNDFQQQARYVWGYH